MNSAVRLIFIESFAEKKRFVCLVNSIRNLQKCASLKGKKKKRRRRRKKALSKQELNFEQFIDNIDSNFQLS